MNGYLTLSPEVRETLGHTSPEHHASLAQGARFLLALSTRTDRFGRPVAVYSGIPATERARRRAKGRVASASRRANRSR